MPFKKKKNERYTCTVKRSLFYVARKTIKNSSNLIQVRKPHINENIGTEENQLTDRCIFSQRESYLLAPNSYLQTDEYTYIRN